MAFSLPIMLCLSLQLFPLPMVTAYFPRFCGMYVHLKIWNKNHISGPRFSHST